MNSSTLGMGEGSGGDTEWSTLHCSKDALTDFFGWFLQGILATLAFTCLIGELLLLGGGGLEAKHVIGRLMLKLVEIRLQKLSLRERFAFFFFVNVTEQ